MQRAQLDQLPTELIQQCLNETVSLEAIMQFGLVSRGMRDVSHSEQLWQPFFKEVEPVANALIHAVNAEADTASGKLSKHHIMRCLALKNFVKLKEVLRPYQTINLIYVSYEQTARQDALNFFKLNRCLYLSREFVEQHVLNLKSVKRLLTYSLPIENIDFASLFDAGRESYQGKIIFANAISDDQKRQEDVFTCPVIPQTSCSAIQLR